MSRARWSLPLVVAWLLACPLVSVGLFTCHTGSSADGPDCCQPLEGSSRASSGPAPASGVAVAASVPALVALVPRPLPWARTAPPPAADALQAVLSVYRV